MTSEVVQALRLLAGAVLFAATAFASADEAAVRRMVDGFHRAARTARHRCRAGRQLLNGELYGRATDVPWGMVFRGGVTRLDTPRSSTSSRAR
jgi:hypothetical protein